MDRFARFLIGAVLALVGASALAGYAEAVPPVGWSSSGTFNFSTPSANAAVYASTPANTIRTTATITAAGRAVTVPASMRFAANAGQFLAGKAFHPAALAVLALPYVVQWAAGKFELGADASEPGGQGWFKRIPGSGWRVTSAPAGFPQGITTSLGATPHDAFVLWAAAASAADASFNYGIRSESGATAQMGKYLKSGSLYGTLGMSAVQITAPDSLTKASEAEFSQTMSGVPIPAPLPTYTPWDWPVEAPVVNPNPYPTGAPSPVVLPTGQPIWDPVTQKWIQPAVRVVPSPTTQSPWRVDLQPIEVNNPNNSPLGDPVPDPFNPTASPGTPLTTPSSTSTVTAVTNPNGQPTGTTATEKPADTPLLCEVFPDILACQKLGSVAATPMAQSTKNLAVTKQDGFGPSNGSCPSNRSLALHGLTLELSYQPICTAATSLRPIVLALAYLSAALAFMGLSRKE